jgi:hypothetical protein
VNEIALGTPNGARLGFVVRRIRQPKKSDTFLVFNELGLCAQENAARQLRHRQYQPAENYRKFLELSGRAFPAAAVESGLGCRRFHRGAITAVGDCRNLQTFVHETLPGFEDQTTRFGPSRRKIVHISEIKGRELGDAPQRCGKINASNISARAF